MDPKRRVWVILDELGSLQQLPYLTSGLAEARKFGGCFVIGVQSAAQLAKTYGFEGRTGNFIFVKHAIYVSCPGSRNSAMVIEEPGRNGR